MLGQEFDTLLDLLRRPDFLMAAAFGVTGALVARAAGAHRRLAGAVLGATFLAVVFSEPPPQVTIGVPLIIVIGLAAIGGYLAGERRTFGAGALVLAIAAGTLALSARPSEMPWMDLASGVALLIGAAVIPIASVRLSTTATISMVVISLVGVWATVPDTDLARVALGASVGLLALIERTPWPRAAWSSLGAVVAAIVAFTGAGSAAVRPGSAVGAWATLSGFAVVALATSGLDRRVRLSFVIVTHVVLTLVAARVAGFRESPVAALVIMAPAAAIAVVVVRRFGLEAKRRVSVWRA